MRWDDFEQLGKRVHLPGFALAGLMASGASLIWLRYNHDTPGSLALRLSDLVNYYYPMTQHAARRLADGELPLWNPYACSGIPMLATMQIGAFYPGNWLALLMPADEALGALMWAECALGAWFAALFFRAAGRSGTAAAIGGLLFVYACLIGESLWPPAVSVLIWLPWQLLCVEKLSRSWSWRWSFALAAGTALQIAAGFPQYLVYGFYLVAPYALFRLLDLRRDAGTGWASVGMQAVGMAGAVLLGVGLASVQLLPSLELVLESARREALSADAMQYLVPPTSALGLLHNALDASPRSLSSLSVEGSGYVGIATVLLIVPGVIAGRRASVTWALALLGALFLLLSDGYRGWASGVFRIYAALPWGGAFRSPERLSTLYLFVVIALAVRGYDEFGRGFPSLRDNGSLRVLVICTTAIGLLLIVWLGPPASLWRAALGLCLLALVWISSDHIWARRSCQAAMLGLVVCDLALATGSYGWFRPFPAELSQRFRNFQGDQIDGPVADDLRAELGFDRLEIVSLGSPRTDFAPWTGAEPVHDLYRISCYEPLVPVQWQMLFENLKGGRQKGALMADLSPTELATLYDVTSVKLVMAAEQGKDLDFRRNADALPRAYLVRDYRIASQESAFDHIRRSDFDFHTAVTLEEDPRIAAPAPSQATAADVAQIVSYADERVEIEVRSGGRGLLVLTDTYYPGWEARVDGREERILRANGLYRAVGVPTGTSRVVFEYRPASLLWGARISLASLTLVVALSVAFWRRRSGRTSSDRAGASSA